MIDVSVRTVTPDLQGTKPVKEGVGKQGKEAMTAGFELSQHLVPKDTSELMFSGIPPNTQQDGSILWAYDAPHALPVEYGSRPHWAPIAPLLGWARRVLGDESAAYAVQQKIAQEGTAPQPYVRPGFRRVKAILGAGSGVVGQIKTAMPVPSVRRVR